MRVDLARAPCQCLWPLGYLVPRENPTEELASAGATFYNPCARTNRRTVQVSGEGAAPVWFYVELTVLAIAVIAFSAWFVRTPLFRAHRHGNWKDPGQTGTGRSKLGS